MSERMVILVLLPILAIAGIYAVNASFEDAGVDVSITGESFNGPAGGGLVTLDQSNRPTVFYQDHVVVKGSNGNVTVEGEDYIWHQDNGTLEVLAGGDLDGDNQATIDYGYDVPTTEQRDGAEAWGKTQNAIVKPLLIAIPFGLLALVITRVVS